MPRRFEPLKPPPEDVEAAPHVDAPARAKKGAPPKKKTSKKKLLKEYSDYKRLSRASNEATVLYAARAFPFHVPRRASDTLLLVVILVLVAILAVSTALNFSNRAAPHQLCAPRHG